MAAKKTEPPTVEITIEPAGVGEIEVGIVGTSPIICNRLAEKARRELLLPGPPKTAASKQSTLKHDPLAEFRASPYIIPDANSPTLLGVPASAFKGAMMTAALDTPGAKKAQMGRLIFVQGERAPLYGIPELLMSVVRSADMNKTPDVRSRAIIRRWATTLTIQFVTPILKMQSVFDLLKTAGIIAGVGDWRPEKGKGTFGQFRVVIIDDPELLEIQANGGRELQELAMAEPTCYDHETEDLFGWFQGEVTRRGFRTKEAA